eukprot:8875424-Ditylum_brightwellii.AAC.1
MATKDMEQTTFVLDDEHIPNMAPREPNRQDSQQQHEKFPFLEDLRGKYPHQPIFLQAVEEMALSLETIFADKDRGEFYKRAFVAMAEPERAISFRVPWMDDEGRQRFNRGWRVEFS